MPTQSLDGPLVVNCSRCHRHFSWHFGLLSTLIHGINPYVWCLLILLDPSGLLVGLLPSWWSNLRENLHRNSYATKIQCGIFFAFWRQLFGCVVILKMTSARGLFLGRATSPSSLSCCPPPHLTHTHTHKCTHNSLCLNLQSTNKSTNYQSDTQSKVTSDVRFI